MVVKPPAPMFQCKRVLACLHFDAQRGLPCYRGLVGWAQFFREQLRCCCGHTRGEHRAGPFRCLVRALRGASRMHHLSVPEFRAAVGRPAVRKRARSADRPRRQVGPAFRSRVAPAITPGDANCQVKSVSAPSDQFGNTFRRGTNFPFVYPLSAALGGLSHQFWGSLALN